MFEPSGIITITTDFGVADGYSGVMEAVILSRFRYARVVRITDSIPPHDIRAGAWVLMNSCPYFPEGTVHIAVVDPGVGTDRKIIVALAGGHLFVAPDNGLISFVLKRLSLQEVRTLENMSFSMQEISRTFHGRDIITPTAAALAYGKMRFDEVGGLTDIVRIEFPECSQRGNEIEGEVLYRDVFGNLITNIPGDLIKKSNQDGISVLIAGRRIKGISKTYLSGTDEDKGLKVLEDSSGFLSVSLSKGSAGELLGCGIGEKVIVIRE